jgi:AbiJ N-terminal domain 4
MAITNLFSKRQKRLRGEISDVLTYDDIPETLRVQIVHIIRDAIGKDGYNSENAKEVYDFLHKTLCREYGLFSLVSHRLDAENNVLDYFLETKDTEKAIDIIELSFKAINVYIGNDFNRYKYYVKIIIEPKEAIEELNQRFKEHAIGYQFDGGEIIRVDSTYAHSEITKPTISLLQSNKFTGANEEYLKAHEHYRHGRNKECLAECLKALESTLKIICKEKGWTYNQNDTSSKLIQICFDNNLIPSFSQSQFTSLRSLLESGIPTIRNRLGGHGQGQVPQKVDDEITRYAINLTGTNIIFLIEQSGIK